MTIQEPSDRDDRAAPPPDPPWRLRLWALALIAACALTYANSLSNPFVLDDVTAIAGNPVFGDAGRLTDLFSQTDGPMAGRPLVALSFAIDAAIGGQSVHGYRVVNLLLHIACALLVLGCVRRALVLPAVPPWLRRRSVAVAGASALVWAVHPLNSEVVDYVVQRSESMMALCYLSTIYCSLRDLDSPFVGPWRTAAFVACALGMACKESNVTAPLAVVFLDRALIFGSWKTTMAERRGFYAALASTWLLLVWLNGSAPRADSAGFATGVSPWTYLLNQTKVISHYLALSVWPRNLVAVYGWPLPLTIGDVWPYGLLLILLLSATAIAWWRRPPLGLFGIWFFLTLAPASSIVPVATEVGAERRMYLPLIAIVVFGVLATMWLWSLIASRARLGVLAGRWAAVGSFALVSCCLAVRTIVRNRDYASDLALVRSAVAHWPSPQGHQLLGEHLMSAGDEKAAIVELEAAVPGDSFARNLLGLALFNQGRPDEAIAQLDAFVKTWHAPVRPVPHWLEPTDDEVLDARLIIGRALAQLQRWPEVLAQAASILASSPSNADAVRLQADAFYGERRFAEAAEAYRRFTEMRQRDANALVRLGLSLEQSGRASEARDAFQRAVDANPRNLDAQRELARAHRQ